jgi:DNA polymerase III alpha subunit
MQELVFEDIVEFEYYGDCETFDIEVDHPDHVFFANDIAVSNSHSVSYAINSYYCAWLLTYHETEWVTAYLEATAGTKKAPKALSEVKSHGFEIAPIDINYATESWTALDGRRFMPSFYSCKGIGEAAIKEIMEKRPYRSLEDFLWNEDGSWKHSKCNKRVMEALIKIRALDSLNVVGDGAPFRSYKQLCSIVIENFDDIKKQPKKNPDYGRQRLKELTLEDETQDEWGFQDLVSFESELMGTVDIEKLIPSRIARLLRERDIMPLDDLQKSGIHWFMVSKSTPKKTKNGKPYLMLDCMSSSGKTQRMFCWDTSNKPPFEPYTLLVGEVENGNFGLSTKYSKVKVINA